MTIVVTVKVTDGIVLAADSAATFYGVGPAPKIYNNANKIFNLVRGKPIGALVYGAGGIGSESVETLSKDFRSQTKYNPEYEVDNSKYTVHGIAEMVRGFLFDKTYKSAYPNGLENFYMGYRVCGYSSGATLPEVWEFSIYGDKCTDLNEVQSKEDFGVRWAGENEALDRLLLGATSHLRQVLQNRGMTEDEAQEAYLEIVRETGALVTVPAMPIQDAIDVAQFLVETAAKFTRYGLRPETIGGPTEIAAITKHEGFKWVKRKHYYNRDLNRETDHV